MNDKEIKAWRLECQAGQLIKKMEKRGFNALYAPTAEEAKQAVLSLIPEAGTVGLVGSQTMNQLGVYAHLRESGRELVDHAMFKAQNAEEADDYKRRVFTVEAMLASANAVDGEGRLYNIDGVGNRVAAIAYGPKRVIAVVGMNKVCHSNESALERARTLAAPLNTQRIAINPHFTAAEGTPCVLNGSCADCTSEDCICATVVATRFCKPPARVKVILVGEDLGF